MVDKILSSYHGILSALQQKPLTIDELARTTRAKQGWLLHPLRVLGKQGLVTVLDGHYAVTQTGSGITELVHMWREDHDRSLYGAAQEIAKMILQETYEVAAARDVLLFGSLVRGESNPRDIDMTVLHAGSRIFNFEPDPYKERPFAKREEDEPISPENFRVSAWRILRKLGSKRDPDVSFGEARVKDAYDLAEEILDRFGGSVEDSLDLHALHVTILDPKQGWMRDAALKDARDPTFYHTMLSQGRLYDLRTHDFTMPVEEKYPGCIALFPALDPKYHRS